MRCGLMITSLLPATTRYVLLVPHILASRCHSVGIPRPTLRAVCAHAAHQRRNSMSTDLFVHDRPDLAAFRI